MKNFDRVDYLVIGHVVRDIKGKGFQPGGIVTFAAITAKNLGYKVGVVTSTNDLKLIEAFRDNDISVHVIPAKSSTVFDNIYIGAARTQRILSVASPIVAEHVPERWRKTSIVHLGPVAQELSTNISKIFPPQTLIGITPQGWLRRWDKNSLVSFEPLGKANKVLKNASVIITSLEDFGGNDKELQKIIANASTVVVTLAEKGALLYQEGKHKGSFSSRPAKVIDPTGAGDVFASAFLIRLLETNDHREACRFANIVASLSTEGKGIKGIPHRRTVEDMKV